MFHNASEMSLLPAPPKTSHAGRPVLGYVGCIGSWFDWPLVHRLAETSPDASVHIVGPCFSRPPRPLPGNVTLFPACTHEQAIDHLKHFSVGLIPFKRTRLTDAVDPIKYYEYRGMGLPVLTARFGEMTQRGVSEDTYFMEAGPCLPAAVSAALSRRPDAAAIAEFRRQNTWNRRFEATRLFERLETR
jgi:hypothetical protein